MPHISRTSAGAAADSGSYKLIDVVRAGNETRCPRGGRIDVAVWARRWRWPILATLTTTAAFRRLRRLGGIKVGLAFMNI